MCSRDFFLTVHVASDVVVGVDVDLESVPHINDHECGHNPAGHLELERAELEGAGLDVTEDAVGTSWHETYLGYGDGCASTLATTMAQSL